MTVPFDYEDTHLRNINGFNQKVLKVGNNVVTQPYRKNDYIVQAIRFKTNNETELKFNYKAVLESVNSPSHFGIQPYFTARVINNSGSVVSEFTLVADEFDCNLSFHHSDDSTIGFTKDWQTATLDISSIPNFENFKIEFISATCGLGGHYTYAFIDDICIQQTPITVQGAVTLDPFTSNCPSSSIAVCGNFTIPNTGSKYETIVSLITLNLFDENQNIVYSNSSPTFIDTTNNTFCFDLNLSSYPDISNANYNVGATVYYGTTSPECISNIFPASDNDAAPGFDITFNACSDYPCDLVTQSFNTSICDLKNDEMEIVDLSSYNSNLTSTLATTFKYFKSLLGAQNIVASEQISDFKKFILTPENGEIFVRISTHADCFQIVNLKINLIITPEVNIDPVLSICENTSRTINAGDGYDSYLWSTDEVTSSISVSTSGDYWVIVTKNEGTLSCVSPKYKFKVITSNIATVKQVISSDWTQNENTISVLLTSSSVGNYEYSLNGVDFQNSNTFYGLGNDKYTIYIRDKNGCGINTEEVYLLMHPKYFTPNGDGINDFWKIKFSENEPNLTVTIFDRFGKFITQYDSNNAGWNGLYNGKELPSADYWFVVKRENGKEHRGHFTLKR